MELPKTFQEKVEIVSIKKPSSSLTNVEVRIKVPLLPQERGLLLLDLEDSMCIKDPSIRIWHTPLGDRNTLRNLRGVVL
jgi:hypothetical protein